LATGIPFAQGLAVNMLDSKLSLHMPAVRAYRERLAVLQGVWDNLSLLSQMSGDGTNMQTTRAAFEQLAGALVDNLAAESQKKAVQALHSKAQVAIDVLVRNLFERTADIGFLCADQDVQQFMLEARTQAVDNEHAHAKQKQALLQRLAEYVAKYSVYENIVLLAPDGEVLLQLNGQPAVMRSHDPLLTESLRSSAGYVETFRKVDLFPQQEQSLIYSYRVTAGQQALGVLCLCFRFDDESQAIFKKLLDAQDWTALIYLDAAGRVIASSDRWQIPVGASFEAATQRGDILRFAGREYLAVNCAAKPYQGYGGPGWSCRAMIPLEQACNGDNNATETLPPAALAAMRKNNAAFSPELQQVPIQAEGIQRELNRTVWNGHIRIGNQSDTNSAFSKVLLREISHNGRKTQDVFEHSIADLQQTVISSVFRDSLSVAALSVDILDRNLYERANDCRWWALDRTLSRHLSTGSKDAAAVTAVLQQINQLYTVYRTLVVFDTDARVVAVSNPQHRALVGKPIDQPWARATLSLVNSQSYHVSPFEPSAFYDNQPTLIYGAAIRGDNGRVVGGIGVVFDTAPQLQAMLNDALMGIRDGSVAMFVSRQGQILSATDVRTPGEQLDIESALLTPPAEGLVRVTIINDVYYVVGAQPTSGYREYPGLNVVALVMMPLGNVDHDAVNELAVRRSAEYQHAPAHASNLELATFWVADQWLAVSLVDVIEAVDTSQLHSLPNKRVGQAGYVMYAGKAVLVADLAALMNRSRRSQGEIVLVRTGSGKTLGLLVDSLDDIPQVSAGDIIKSLDMFASGGLTEGVVRSSNAEGPLLLILSPDRVAAELTGQALGLVKQAS
jgi:chemotaxis signal transduction protein